MINLPSLLVVLGVLAGAPDTGARRAPFISIGPMVTPPSPNFPFDFEQSVLGDFTSIDMLPTEIIIGYLGSCAGSPLNLDSCLVQTYIERYIRDVSFENLCEPPPVPMEEIRREVMESRDLCISTGVTTTPTDVEVAIASIWAILQSDQCWERFCRRDIQLDIESFWIEKCANIMLPYPLPTPNEMRMFNPQRVKEDATLTCMLHIVMSTPPSDFGLDISQEGATERCYPPGYNNITEICPEYLGRLAYEKCTRGPPKDSEDESSSDDMPSMDMSFNYEMSYNYYDFDFSMSFDFKPKDEEQMMMLIEDLCITLEQLSTDKGRECLLPLCDDPTPAPTTMAPFTISPSAPTSEPSTSPAPSPAPSVSPTSAPSTSPAPSPAPSMSPSAAPSASSSLVPSIAPSSVPSFAPSAAPSSIPSISPSTTPSSAPSTTPSSVPSASPSSAPSSTPSATPSEFPTSSPTLSEVQAVMQAQIVSTITLRNGVGLSNVPLRGEGLEEFIAVLESSIAQVIADIPGSETVTVISLNGIPLNRRLRDLQADENSLIVEFTVEARRNCYLEDCTDEQLLSDFIGEYMTALESATTTGDLATEIQEEATSAGVTELETVEVPPDSYTLVSFTGDVVPPDPTPSPAPREISGSPSHMFACPMTVACLVGILLPFMF